MSVIRWDEISITRSVDAQGHRDYTRTFKAYTDNTQDGPITVMSAIPIFQWVSYYSVPGESDPYALAQTAQAQPDGDEQRVWVVTYNYSTRPFDYGSINNPTAGTSPPGLGASPATPTSPTQPGGQSPAVRPWSLHFGVENVKQAAPPVDVFGQKVKASNGQPYTGLEYDVALPYFELTIPTLRQTRRSVGTSTKSTLTPSSADCPERFGAGITTFRANLNSSGATTTKSNSSSTSGSRGTPPKFLTKARSGKTGSTSRKIRTSGATRLTEVCCWTVRVGDWRTVRHLS